MAVTPAVVDLRAALDHLDRLRRAVLATCFMPSTGLPEWVGDPCVRTWKLKVHGPGPPTLVFFHPTHGYEAALVHGQRGEARWVGAPVDMRKGDR